MENPLFGKYSIFTLPNSLVIFAAFLLISGLMGLIKNKPFIINSKRYFFVLLIAFMPDIVNEIIGVTFYGETPAFSLLIAYLLVIILAMLLIRSYTVFCADYIDIRDAIIFSLQNNSLDYKEEKNKFHLVNTKNELKVSSPGIMKFTGTGRITMKNREEKVMLKKIVDDMKLYIRENNIHANKTGTMFHVICGIGFILLIFIL
jgi:hypothetical protein